MLCRPTLQQQHHVAIQLRQHFHVAPVDLRHSQSSELVRVRRGICADDVNAVCGGGRLNNVVDNAATTFSARFGMIISGPRRPGRWCVLEVADDRKSSDIERAHVLHNTRTTRHKQTDHHIGQGKAAVNMSKIFQ